MALTWSTIPLLPLTCILEHLTTEDAMAAMSTCRHWRAAMLLYEGRKRTLKLRAQDLEKNIYLTNVFRKHTRRLHIYLDCFEADLERLVDRILPQYFDSAKLQELVFIGPSYIQEADYMPFITLKRVMTESLVFKHLHSLQKLSFMGCGMGAMKNENERYTHRNIEVHSRLLKFSRVQTPDSSILSSANQHLMLYSTLSHIVVDYDQIKTSSLETLSNLSNFRYLTLNVSNKNRYLRALNWHGLNEAYKEPLLVCVNIISMPSKRFNDIIENVLVEGMTLVALKVMFCKTLSMTLLSHVSRLYHQTLEEVVWVDSPYDSIDPNARVVNTLRAPQPETYSHVNPFVLLCWQCSQLRRLVIHGYWIWQYDLLGFVRLRKTLMELDVSAIYKNPDKFSAALRMSEEGVVRVLDIDVSETIAVNCVQEVNEYTEFVWRPTRWRTLHPALRQRAADPERADYVVREANKPLVVTLY